MLATKSIKEALHDLISNRLETLVSLKHVVPIYVDGPVLYDLVILNDTEIQEMLSKLHLFQVSSVHEVQQEYYRNYLESVNSSIDLSSEFTSAKSPFTIGSFLCGQLLKLVETHVLISTSKEEEEEKPNWSIRMFELGGCLSNTIALGARVLSVIPGHHSWFGDLCNIKDAEAWIGRESCELWDLDTSRIDYPSRNVFIWTGIQEAHRLEDIKRYFSVVQWTHSHKSGSEPSWIFALCTNCSGAFKVMNEKLLV